MLSDGVVKHTLDNGLTVLLKETDHAPVVAIVTHVKAGYFNEEDNVVGISHLIEHMFFKGTRRRGVGDIARETKALGGILNASTIYDHTLYYTVLPSRSFARGLDIQADALIDSIFDPKEIEKETEVVIQEAKRKLDTPGAVAREKLLELAFERHRIRRWRIGTEEGLRSLTRTDFLQFYQNHYRPENIILSVVGDVDPITAIKEIERHYAAFPRGDLKKSGSDPEPPQERFKYRRLTGDLQQSYLAVGFHTPPLFHDDSYALEVLAFILGRGRSSRLYQVLKQQTGLVNSVSASCYSLEDVGVLFIHCTLQASKLIDCEKRLVEQISKLQEEPVRSDELERALNVLESMYVASMESASGMAELLAAYEALGDYRLAETYLQRLAEVTVSDIRRVARNYLCHENASLLEYVPADNEPAAFSADNWPVRRRDEREILADESPVQDSGSPAVLVFDSGQQETRAHDVRRLMLPDGTRILFEQNSALPTIAIGVFAAGGRSVEGPRTAGLSGLCLRTALRGTTTRSADQIAREFEGLGSTIQISNDPDYLSFSSSVLSKNFRKALDILSDVILHPEFGQDELEKEKTNTLNMLAQEKDDMFRYPLRLFYEKLFGSHPYGLPDKGMPEGIRGFSPGDLRSWHQQQFCRQNVTISIVGDIEEQEIVELVEEKLTHDLAGTAAPQLSEQIEYPTAIADSIEERQKEQTAIVLGFSGPGYTHPDYFPLLVLQNAISGLGGRFFEELRGRQSLAYTVSAFLVARRLGGTFLSYIATSPDNEEAAINGLLGEFRKLRAAPITAEELGRSIEYTAGGFEIGMETNSARMRHYAHAELVGEGIEGLENYPKRIRKVSQEETFHIAEKYFNLDNYAVGMVRGTQLKN